MDIAGGEGEVSDLLDAYSNPANVSYYCKLLKDRSCRRRLTRICQATIEDMNNDEQSAAELISSLQEALLSIGAGPDAADMEHVGTIMPRVLKYVADSALGQITGLSTGLRDLDAITGGLQSGDMITLAGRPSMGKTALGMQIAMRVASAGTPVLFASYEMGKDQLILRALCSQSGVTMHRVRMGTATKADTEAIGNAMLKVKDYPLWLIDRSTYTVQQVYNVARRMKNGGGLGLLVMDYLQLIPSQLAKGSARHGNREQEVSSISRSIKAMAKVLAVPVIPLAQLSREVERREDRTPMLSDLRESGSVEQDSDVVMFLYRDDYYHPNNSKEPNVTRVIIGKQRNGPVGTIRLSTNKELMTFHDYTPEQTERQAPEIRTQFKDD
jgi:replicative DNA helicase